MVNIQYMRQAKQAVASAALERIEDLSGKLNLRRLHDVTLTPQGVIPDVEATPHRLIDDCEYCTSITEGGSGEAIPGRTLYGGYLRSAYGHFLMNTTARLWPVFDEEAAEYDRIVFFSDNMREAEISGNAREFLQLAGVWEKCVVLPGRSYRFEHIDAADPSIMYGRYSSRELLLPFEKVRAEALRRFGETLPDTPVVISRSGWKDSAKTQINIGAIETVFTDNGYEAMSPESTPLGYMVARLNSAREVVSPSGSAAHNILFAPEKPLVVLERSAPPNMYQLGIDKARCGDTTYIDCYWQPFMMGSVFNLTIYGLTAQMRRFIADRGMRLSEGPEKEMERHPRREFRRHLAHNRVYNGYGVGLMQWEDESLQAVAEAYYDSLARYGRYLNRMTPVAWYDYLSPRVWYRLVRGYLRSHT
ncbi:MAG: glycosyltransferase family 61 protein [Muribaculaceae bacterium]|nr:glycosyltransferase family 61 protein [Muribaculaceae bacterium]